MKKKSTIRFRLYGVFVISIILPIILATVLITTFLNHKNIKSTEQQVINITNQIATNINTYNLDLRNVTNIPLLYKDMSYVLSSFNRGYYITDILEQYKLQDNYISTITKLMFTNTNNINSICFYPSNPSNSIVYEIDKAHAGLQTITTNNYQDNIYYKNAINNDGEIYYSDLFEKEINGLRQRFFSALRAIKDYDTQKIIGVLKIDVSFEKVEKTLKSIVTSERSFIILANSQNVLYSSKPYDPSFLNLILSSQGSFEMNSNHYRIISTDVSNSDWRVIYLMSEDDLAAANGMVYVLSISVGMLTIAAAFFIFKKGSNRMVLDMKSIVSALGRIREGDLTTRITIDKDSELKTIAQAVNKMTIDLDSHIKQEYLAVVEQKKAEYRSLQSQINPHFLYNTLNCLLALNHMGERNKLESAILNLTKLFRYTSVSEGSVSLKTECDFLEKYINLQQIHFEDQLIYQINIDEDCEDVFIPKLVLQPLVENCIIHGMGTNDHPMMIEIAATYSESTEMYTILIKDNGVGFDVNDNKGHIGLSNVRERLMLWNDSVDFSIDSKQYLGTTIKISFYKPKESL